MRLITVTLAALLSLPVRAEVELAGAWVRALPPTQSSTAAYLTVANTGPQEVAVIGAQAAVAGRAEIHTTREVDGLMRMERLPQLEIAPGATLSLAPGGTHLMLMELQRMPQVGETVPLCLELASGESVCTDAEVRKSSGAASGHQHHHH
jgi:copper(I)-binding protein